MEEFQLYLCESFQIPHNYVPIDYNSPLGKNFLREVVIDPWCHSKNTAQIQHRSSLFSDEHNLDSTYIHAITAA